MVDKTKAVELRQLGLSYAEIAESLGCSEVWCKKNLKGVTKNVREKQALEQLITRAKAGSITYKDIREAVIEAGYPEDNQEKLDNAIRRFKDSVNKEPGTIIRPYWMKPTESLSVLQQVISEINDLDQRIYESVLNIREKYDLDESYTKSIYHVLKKLQWTSSVADMSFERYVENLQEVALLLQDRYTKTSGSDTSCKKV